MALFFSVLPFTQKPEGFFIYTKHNTLGVGGPISNEGALLTIAEEARAENVLSGASARAEEKLFLESESGSFFGPSPSLVGTISSRDGIKKYKVQKGDTFSNIAARFGITLETVKNANPKIKNLRVGAEVLILPVSGILYSVEKGDTLQSLVDRFGADPALVKKHNPDYLKILETPDASLILPNVKNIPASISKRKAIGDLADLGNYFILPAKGWNWGLLHEHNAVDIANSCGSPIYAAADGVVVEESSDGSWNNGYGNFILVEHPNMTQTRYAHTLKNIVRAGDIVSQGKQIALIGNSGNTEGSTGCHLHFEVIGAKNPFALK